MRHVKSEEIAMSANHGDMVREELTLATFRPNTPIALPIVHAMHGVRVEVTR